MLKLEVTEQQLDPRQQYIHDLNQLLDKYKTSETEVILIGDTNINYHKKHPEWSTMMHSHSLVNWMTTKWPDAAPELQTWKSGAKSSWIDHVWMPAAQVRDGILVRAGVEQVGGAHGSDHALIAAEMNWSKMLGHTTERMKIPTARLRTLMSTNKELAGRYDLLFCQRDAARSKTPEGSLVSRARRLVDKAKVMRRNGTDQEQDEMQNSMDTLMEEVVAELLTVEDILRTETAHLNGNHSRNHWSDWMGNKMRVLRLMILLIRTARVRSNRTKVGAILKEIRENTTGGYAHNTTLADCPPLDATRKQWVSWIHTVETTMKELQSTLSARKRVTRRKAMKEKIAERERQAALQKSLKKFLNYALRRCKSEPKPLSLMIQTKGTTTA